MRVLLLEIPPLLRDILEHGIQLQSDCELLRDARRTLQMLSEQTVPPDVVILGLAASEDATLVSALFSRWPRVQVVTVTQTGNDAALYELTPRRTALGHMSPTEIVDALREAIHRSREMSEE
jgi:DNA-binding NarL/FixJ family response regulator